MKSKENTELKTEMIKLRWDEFKYRHTHYWGLFFRFSFAVLFLLAIPYIYPDEIKQLSAYIMLFPLAGILVCLIAAWLLAAEYERLRQVSRKLDDLTPKEFLPDRFELSGIRKILKINVGIFVNLVFLVGFMLLSVLELFVIYYVGGLSS